MSNSRRLMLPLILLIVVSSANAQSRGERAETWDIGVQASYLGSNTLDGEQGSSLSIDSEWGFGLWGTYNFTNRLALGFDINWTQPRYEARFIPEDDPDPVTISTRLDIFSIQGRGVFHFFEGPLTPFVEAGIGWTNVDSNVSSSPPINGCWWDPWWGYICRPFYSTYQENLLSYSGALGLRWDINPYYGLRAAYGLMGFDSSSRSENGDFDMARLEFAWRF